MKAVRRQVFYFCGNMGVVTRRDYVEVFWGFDNILCVVLGAPYLDKFML